VLSLSLVASLSGYTLEVAGYLSSGASIISLLLVAIVVFFDLPFILGLHSTYL